MPLYAACPRFTTAVAIAVATALVPSAVPMPAAAQTNPVVPTMIPPSASETIYAKIEAINPETREVTLTAADGQTVPVIAQTQVSLDNLKVGDKVQAHYYRSVAFVVSKSMQAQKGQTTELPPEQAQLISQHAEAKTPDGMSLPMTHITGLIVGVHPQANSVDVVNPNGGGVFTLQASDPSRGAMIGSLKVGDTVTAVISPAIATSIEPEKGFFANLFGG
ncbi:MAG: hypothetical protein JOZ17_26100 [Acetobacteraceae bacterium]|nr:hypothetical protein [Acetobacteraceae bacterium]